MIENDKRNWLLLAAVALVSIVIRLKINFSTEFIPGGNGAYYLILVRSILEKGSVMYADFPLLFWLEAVISFVIIKLGITNFNLAIDLTSRIFDSVVPVLSIVPAYLFTRKILDAKVSSCVIILFASVSVLYFPFFILISEFQKNSLGLLWLFWLIYFLLRVHDKGSLKNIFGALIFLILTALTHYGCIAVGLTIIVVDLLTRYFSTFSFKRFIKIFILLLTVIAISISVVYLINPGRAREFIRIPFEIFNDPIVLLVLRKEPILTPFDFVNIILINSAAIVSLVLFVKKYRDISPKLRSYILSMIILSIFLTSPFLGIEAAQRVYFISYITLLPLLCFIYYHLNHRKTKTILLTAVIISLLFSTGFNFAKHNYSNMNKNLYAEMLMMKKLIPSNDETIVIARHGLEFWSTWIFGVKAFRQESVWVRSWDWYKDIFVLNQKKDKSPFGPAGIYGNLFREPELPEDSYLVYKGNYYDLYKSPSSPKDFSKYNNRKN